MDHLDALVIPATFLINAYKAWGYGFALFGHSYLSALLGKGLFIAFPRTGSGGLYPPFIGPLQGI